MSFLTTGHLFIYLFVFFILQTRHRVVEWQPQSEGTQLVTPPRQFDVVWVITIRSHVKGLQTEGRDITWLSFSRKVVTLKHTHL